MARDLKINNQTLDPNLYVYRQARDVSKTQVDWANLTKDLTDDLTKIRDDREKTRQDARDANRKLLNELNTLDPYAHETANTKIQDAAYQSSQLLMTDFDLVVNGQKKLKDYKQTEQLLSDNFNSLKGAMDTYNDHFVEAEERVQSGEANIGEVFNNESLAGFGSLSALNIVVQPSGAINLIKKQFDANGNEIEADLSNPANLMSLTHVNDRVQYKGNYEDPNETAQSTVNTLGAFITADFMNRQAVASLEDFRLMTYTDANGVEKKGTDVINSMVNEIITTDNQKLSLLQLSGFSSNDVTQDPEEAKRTGKILQIPNKNGSGAMGYEFTEEHEAILQEKGREIIERQIDSKMSKVKGVAPTPSYVNQYTMGEDIAEASSEQYLTLVDGILTGDAATSEANAASLVDLLNRNPGKGDQEARVTSIEKKINDDGTVDVVISREGLADKVISSAGGKTTEDAASEFFNSINTTNVVYADARRDRGAIGSDFTLDAISYTAPTQTYEINIPDFNVSLAQTGTGQSAQNLRMADFTADAIGTPGSMTKNVNLGRNKNNIVTGLEGVIQSVLNTQPGLADVIGDNYDVSYKTVGGQEYLYFEMQGAPTMRYKTGLTHQTNAQNINGTLKNMITQAAESAKGSAPGDNLPGWDE